MKLRIANKILNHPNSESVYSSAQISKAENHVEKLSQNQYRRFVKEATNADNLCGCGCVDGHDCVCYYSDDYDYEYGTCDGL